MHTYGDLSSVKNSTKVERTTTTGNGTSAVNSGGTITITLTCDWGDKDTYTPALNTAYASGSAYLLTSSSQEQLPGALCKITLTYTATSESAPSTTYCEQSSQIEVPIQEHPDFDDWADDWDEENQRFNPDSDKFGISSYIKGTTTVTKASYFSSKPDSERDGIGKTESPGGDYGSADKWLLIGANRSKQGNWWVMQKTYLYSAEDWNSDIYS